MEIVKSPLQELELVPPDVERDAPISLGWLEGDEGRNTLRLMGNTDEHNNPSTLEEEKKRVQDFIESKDQLTWMIKLQDKIVGCVWVNLESSEYLPGPSLHIMIGDPSSRGHGVGINATKTVIKYLKASGNYEKLYTRHLVNNKAAISLLRGIGFEELGEAYKDSDGLGWQNEQMNLT